jgi:hypothetical protein
MLSGLLTTAEKLIPLMELVPTVTFRLVGENETLARDGVTV